MNELNTSIEPDKRSPPRNIPVFLCYRRLDGEQFAQWLYKCLDNFKYRDQEGKSCILNVYFDKTAPGVENWKNHHFPSLQSSKALLVVSTPGLATDFSTRDGTDWCYVEMRWWIENHKTAPILIDTTGDGDRWLPKILVSEWPNLNRIEFVRDFIESPPKENKTEPVTQLVNRIVKTIQESESKTVFEDLERSRLQSKRLNLALTTAVLLFLMSTVLALYGDVKKKRGARAIYDRRKQIIVVEGSIVGFD